MAELTKANGGVGSVGVTQYYGGSQLKFFKILVLNGSSQAVDVSAENGVNEAIEKIVQVIETKATLVAMQIENDASGQISVALEMNGAGWDDTANDLRDAIRALGTTVGANSVDVSLSTASSTAGMKLA